MFTNLNEAISSIEKRKNLEKRINMDKLTNLSKLLSYPEKSFELIHVTGTNGKGSFVAFTASILAHYGKKVGMFVSPYIVCFNERIQINGQYISDNDLLHYINELDYVLQSYQIELSFFEFMFFISLIYFRDQKVDIAIIECGIGGLRDATNFINSKVAVITNVGYDHMAQLGNSLESIATNKLGITRSNGKLFTNVCSSLYPLFKDYCQKNQVDLHILANDQIIPLEDNFNYQGIIFTKSLPGKYQIYNASLAIMVIHDLFPSIDHTTIQNGLNNTFWPGRMEVISYNPLIILDGAHNIHAMNALVASLKDSYPNRRVKVLFSALKDKDYPAMIELLNSLANEIVFTEIDDLRKESALVEERFAKIASKAIISWREALKYLVDNYQPNDLIVITGSLHFISLVRQNLLKNK